MSYKKPKKNKKQRFALWMGFVVIFIVAIAALAFILSNLPENEINGNSDLWNDWSQELNKKNRILSNIMTVVVYNSVMGNVKFHV